MQIIKGDQITYQVFEATDFNDSSYLPINKKLMLEYLSQDDDGIFETLQSWRSFINGNFRDGDYLLSEPKQTTLEKWCKKPSEYIDLFVTRIGSDSYVKVEPKDLELSFDYELFYSKDSNFPSAVELYVTARIKN